MDELVEVRKALCQFVIDVVNGKEKIPGNTLQVLPEITKALIELSKFINLQQ
jgi:hypothetical protein